MARKATVADGAAPPARRRPTTTSRPAPCGAVGAAHGATDPARGPPDPLTTDRGVFSAEASTPAPGSCSPRARPVAGGRAPARPRLRLRARSPSRLARAAPGRPGVGGRRERAGPRPLPRQRRGQRRRRRSRSLAPDDVPADLRVRPHLVQPADPRRQGRAPRAARHAGSGRLPPGTGRRRSWSRSTWRRLPGPWLDEQGWPTERLASRAATGSCGPAPPSRRRGPP